MTYRIVVGADGSPHGNAALRWALEVAEVRNGEVTAVFCWQVPFLSFPGAFDREELEKTYKAYLIDTVSAIEPSPKVPVWTLVAEGDPTVALIKAAEDADLLVLGTRGRSAFAGRVLPGRPGQGQRGRPGALPVSATGPAAASWQRLARVAHGTDARARARASRTRMAPPSGGREHRLSAVRRTRYEAGPGLPAGAARLRWIYQATASTTARRSGWRSPRRAAPHQPFDCSGPRAGHGARSIPRRAAARWTTPTRRRPAREHPSPSAVPRGPPPARAAVPTVTPAAGDTSSFVRAVDTVR